MIYIPAIIGFSILFSLGAADKMSDTLSLIVAAACFVMSVFLLLFKRFRKVPLYSVVLLSISFGLLYFSLYSQSADLKIELNAVHTVEGEISQFPQEKYEKYYYILENVKIDGENIDAKARISSEKKLSAQMHDTVKAACFVYENKNADYYLSKEIYLSASISDSENVEIISRNKKSLKYCFEYLRSNIITSLTKYIPKDEAAFLCGILTGDKSEISNSLYIDFKKLGLLHWLAVSGLHLSILAGILNSLLKKANKYVKISVTVTVLTVFAAITGFPSSVVRSLIMNVLVIFADLFYRKAESVNSLGVAVMAICIHSPFAIYDIGFLLSVFSTLGILLFADRTSGFLKTKIKDSKYRVIRRFKNSICEGFACSVSAIVFVLPFSVYIFGTVSVIGPITNIIFMIPFTVLFVAAGVVSILYYIPFADFVFKAVSFAVALVTRVILYLVTKIAGLSYTSISVYTVHFEIWFVITLVLTMLCVIVYKKRFVKFAAAASALIFVIMVFVNQYSLGNSVQICVADGGNELSVIVSDSENTLIIGTDNVYLEASASAMNISEIDAAMILNQNFDDFKGALLLCEEYGAEKLYFKETYIDGATEKEAEKYKAKANTFESEKYKAQFIEAESGVYAVLEIGSRKILICSDKLKNRDISGYYDYVITSVDNGNIDNFKADTVIISSYEDNSVKIAKRFDDIANKYIATGGKGDIILNIKEDKESIRRGYNG